MLAVGVRPAYRVSLGCGGVVTCNSAARGTGRANDSSRNDEVNKRVHAPAKCFTRVLLNVLR